MRKHQISVSVTMYKYFVTVLKQGTVLYLSIYFSNNF